MSATEMSATENATVPAEAEKAGTSARQLFGRKTAATFVLAGAAIVAVGMTVLTLKLPRNENVLAAQPTPVSVRMVSATSRSAIPCAQQTWPYIEAACLKQGGEKMMPVPIGVTAESQAAQLAAERQTTARANASNAAEWANETRNTASIAPARVPETATQADGALLESATPPILLGRVPLPQPRPVAADVDDEEFAPPPRRDVRQRRYYYDDPPSRVVRELNRFIPFGILRF